MKSNLRRRAPHWSLGIMLCLFYTSLQANPIAGSDPGQELHRFYLEKSWYKLYREALTQRKAHTDSPVPDIYAAMALCHYDEDALLQEKINQPWGRAVRHLELAKERDHGRDLVAPYRKGLRAIQRKLFQVGETAFPKQPTEVKAFFDKLAALFPTRRGSWANAYHAGVDASSERYDFEAWDHPYYRLAHTARRVEYLSDEAKELIYLHNLCRLNPTLFSKTYLAVYLEEDRWGSPTDHYVTSLKRDLAKAEPADYLFPYPPYCEAATFHARDLAATNTFGHTSSDGTDTWDRLSRFSDAGGYRAENVQGGTDTPIECFFSLLIDRGVPSLGHRITILNPSLKYMGVGIAKGGKYGKYWVFDFCSRPGTEFLASN